MQLAWIMTSHIVGQWAGWVILLSYMVTHCTCDRNTGVIYRLGSLLCLSLSVLCLYLMVKLKKKKLKKWKYHNSHSFLHTCLKKDKLWTKSWPQCRKNFRSVSPFLPHAWYLQWQWRGTQAHTVTILSTPLPVRLAESTRKQVQCLQTRQFESTENHLTMEIKGSQPVSTERESGLCGAGLGCGGFFRALIRPVIGRPSGG